MNKEVLNLLSGKGGIDTKFQVINPAATIDGNASHIWTVDDQDGQRRVIKQYPDWVHENDIEMIHQYMGQLLQNGFPLAELVGKPVWFDGNFYAVYAYADGMGYDPLNPAHLADMAQKLRMLHDLSQSIKIDGQRNWPTVSGFVYAGSVELLSNAWNVASELMINTNRHTVPIHGDFRKINIRFNENGINRVFDFGNARNDYPEVDLAITLRDIGEGSVEPDSFALQGRFLRIFKDSGIEAPKILPDYIYASSIVITIQESSYLFQRYSRNHENVTKLLLQRETEYLTFLLETKDRLLSLYGGIFT